MYDILHVFHRYDNDIYKEGIDMELTQEEKAIRLQQAVLNSTTEEICNIYDTLGYVEMSAPALGLACRFRGLEVVKVLVEKGATFDFPSTEEIEIKYHCHIGEKQSNGLFFLCQFHIYPFFIKSPLLI